MAVSWMFEGVWPVERASAWAWRMADEVGGGGEASSGGLPQFDFTFWPSHIFWAVIAFAILYWLLDSMLLRQVGGVIEQRRDTVADDLEEAGRLKGQAEAAQAAYEKARADARARAKAIAADTRKTIDDEIAREIDKAEAEFAEQASTADARLREAASAAMAQADAAVADVAGDIVEKLTGARPADAALAVAKTKAAS